ncbi:MAG: hypothetical protein UZ09_BCD002002090 [Bacteroidetes bacterium OLB9]|nr:MAG: hypothetical protein UZ09_BCD002002090 [Bacteroidetes bacterium OLB9]
MKNYYIIFISIGFLLLFAACNTDSDVKTNWRKELSDDHTIPEKRIPALLKAAQFYIDSTVDEENKGLAALNEANKLAIQISSNEWEYKVRTALIRYAKPKSSSDSSQMDNFIKNTLVSINNLTVPTQIALLQVASEYYLKIGNANQARTLIDDLGRIGNLSTENKIKLLSLRAKYYELLNQPAEELKFLLEARNQSFLSKDNLLLKRALEELAFYYFKQKKYITALSFLEECKNLIISEQPVDSLAYYSNMMVIAIFENKSDNWDESSVKSNLVLNFAHSKQYPKLFESAESELRSALMNKNDIQGIAHLYTNRLPNRLQEIGHQDSVLYYRINAYIAENVKDNPSAVANFLRAEKLLDTKNEAYTVNFYIRLAEYYNRHGDFPMMLYNYRRAFDMAVKNNNFFTASEIGAVLLPLMKDLDRPFLLQLNKAKDEILTIHNNEYIRDIELSNVLKNKELEEQRLIEDHNRKSNLQIQVLVLLIILAFMSMIFISNFKVPKWWFKIMSYISLITLFELIIYLLADQMVSITHHEPMKVLAVKASIIALITPLHHWIEHSWVKFLSEHKVLKEFGNSLKKMVRDTIDKIRS